MPLTPASDGTIGLDLVMDTHFGLKLLSIHIDPSWSIGDVSARLDVSAKVDAMSGACFLPWQV